MTIQYLRPSGMGGATNLKVGAHCPLPTPAAGLATDSSLITATVTFSRLAKMLYNGVNFY